MTLPGELGTLGPARANAQRNATHFGRRVDGNHSHACNSNRRRWGDERGIRRTCGGCRMISFAGASLLPRMQVVTTALDQEGRGIARLEGKAVFVEGALIGERVDIETLRRKPNYDLARVTAIHTASASRVEPQCAHFGICGGCSLQHLDPLAQVAIKQRVLEDALWHIGRLKAEQILAPIHGSTWEYRHRARLSVRNVPKKGGVLV